MTGIATDPGFPAIHRFLPAESLAPIDSSGSRS
jgi:hypothetical protein